MNLTQEQIDIINSTGNIKINAIAGSGKTTTVIEYAKTRPAQSKILYLVFNKSVKLEAINKFAEKGLNNVRVETAHSLAYKNIVFQFGYKVRVQGYKTSEIVEILKIVAKGEKHIEYIIANHINKFVAYFCNSDKQKIQDLNYIETITDPKAKAFVKSNYEFIVKQTRIFLKKMNDGEIEITHDFYLKKFHLLNPVLDFDYILFDEGQDASPAMLDVFIKQKAIKVIVGDTHQQIYAWRFAVNSLEKVDFTNYNLSTSFRFSQDIANLSMQVLDLKNSIGECEPIRIIGRGSSKAIKTKAIIARTNLGLLLKAIEYLTERKNIKHIYFEGNINSYTYAEEGASLYDVLNLFNGNHKLIKDELIKSMNGIFDLEEYIKKTEDVQLGMMLEIVYEYGDEIPGIIKSIKEKHVGNEEKDKAEIIFSTVHRCKGMEYDTIQLVNDFINEEKLDSLCNNVEKEISLSKLNEEINLLYVAITRTKNSIYIPEELMPIDFPASSQIHVFHEIEEQTKETIVAPKKEKTYSVEEVRINHKDAYRSWTTELDDELTVMYCEGVSVKDISKHFGRTKGAIYSRIKKLELEELYG
jgi:F-box protein, helicase, 18